MKRTLLNICAVDKDMTIQHYYHYCFDFIFMLEDFVFLKGDDYISKDRNKSSDRTE